MPAIIRLVATGTKHVTDQEEKVVTVYNENGVL